MGDGMGLEMLVPILATALPGLVLWILAVGILLTRAGSPDEETRAWWRLVTPLLGAAITLAFIAGWAVQEPDPADERAGAAVLAPALVAACVLTRAVFRSALAAFAGVRTRCAPIETIGLFDPRVVVTDAFRQAVSEEVLAAAHLHEAAHVRGRDPLRIWLVQLAADLQWPVPGARRRFDAWLLGLEVKRDDEALASGACAEDLAEAILAAARMQSRRSQGVRAGIEGGGHGLAWRVRRLLGAPPAISRARSEVRRSLLFVATSGGVLFAAAWLGLRHGDIVLSMVPGLRR